MSDLPRPDQIQSLHADSPDYRALLGAARSPLDEAFGERMVLGDIQLARAGEWAFLQARMQAPGGGRPDYAGTDFAERAQAGGMSDLYVALLKHEADASSTPGAHAAWRLVDSAIGPGDVAWLTWPRNHGVPPPLLGLKPSP